MSDSAHLISVVQELAAAGVEVHVFGGWAEELLGLVPPRVHGDIDLLHVGQTFERVDGYLRASRRPEVVEKRAPHKRAFVHDGVLVELVLVEPSANGPVTRLWNGQVLEWPELSPREVAPGGLGAVRVVSAAALAFYRAHHATVRAARATWKEVRERTSHRV